MVAILGFDREQILKAVRAMYTEVAQSPERTFHFPTGRGACLFAGYPEPWLDVLPATAVSCAGFSASSMETSPVRRSTMRRLCASPK